MVMGNVIGCLFITITRILTHPDMVGEGVGWGGVKYHEEKMKLPIIYATNISV